MLCTKSRQGDYIHILYKYINILTESEPFIVFKSLVQIIYLIYNIIFDLIFLSFMTFWH